MKDPSFTEPSLALLRPFRDIFDRQFPNAIAAKDVQPLSRQERNAVLALANEHPYLPEPHLCLARGLAAEGRSEEAREAAQKALAAFELMGMPWYKVPGSGNVSKEVLNAAIEISMP